MKKFRKIYGLAILMMIGFQIQLVNAQYAEDALRYSQLGLGVGARELGMGNATVGGVNDYSALFWNPAGLALERDNEFSFGLSWLNYSNNATYLNTTTSGNESVLNLNNIGLVYPLPTSRGSMTLAFGFNRAANYTGTADLNALNGSNSFVQALLPPDGYNLNGLDSAARTNYLANSIPFQTFLADTTGGVLRSITPGQVQQMISFLEGGGLNHWTFGGAMDIGKNLSVGVSLNFASGSYSFEQNFIEKAVNQPDFSQLTYETSYNDDISGFNALFGLMYRKPEMYSFGIAIRTSTMYDINETYSENFISQFKTPDAYGQTSYSSPTGLLSTKYKVSTPYVLSGGISVEPLEWLTLAGDAEYTDWTQLEFTNTSDPALLDENTRIKNGMRATTNLRGGFEITLINIGMKIRGGIIDNPSPWKGQPSSYDQLYYTAGLGFALDERTTLNAAYAYGTWKTSTTGFSDLEGDSYHLGTSESITTSNLNLTLMYRF
jgi:long-subunit fatty acid transport protein